MKGNRKMIKSIWEDLQNQAAYAAKSYSRDLVFEVYGMAKMAHCMCAISHEQFTELSRQLVRNCINNGKWNRKADEYARD